MQERYSYKDFFKSLYKKTVKEYTFSADSPEEVYEWQRKFRYALKERLGLFTLESIFNEWKTDLSGEKVRQFENVKLIDSVKESGYSRYKYIMETLPSVFMPFYMLVPDSAGNDSKNAAMIAIPAHGANKDTVAGVLSDDAVIEKIKRNPKESYGLEFVKQGYIVFCPDPPGYGERLEDIPYEDLAFCPDLKQNSLDCSCKNLAQTAEALGFSLTALEIWDLEKLLDFIMTRPEVDNSKIGCAGFSGGGQYAMWLAALDERVAISVVSGYLHGFYESIMDVHLCPCNYAPGLWKMGDMCDICSLIAPRGLFVENGTNDPENGRCGISGPKKQAEYIRKTYDILGENRNFEFVIPEGKHQWYGECYGFVKEYFGNR